MNFTSHYLKNVSGRDIKAVLQAIKLAGVINFKPSSFLDEVVTKLLTVSAASWTIRPPPKGTKSEMASTMILDQALVFTKNAQRPEA